MSKECLPIAELAAAGSWSRDDPRRRHLDSCTRCQSLLLSLEAFLHPLDVPDGTDLDDMRARLSTDFRGGFVKTGREQPESSGDHGIFSLFQPIRRPALALAAVLVLALGLPRIIGSLGHHLQIVLRSDTEPDSTTIVALPPVSGEADSTGALLLSWHPTPNVDSYRVVLYDGQFQEVDRFATGGDTVLVLLPHSLPTTVGPWDEVFWRVYGFRAGDEVTRSRMQTLEAPDK